MDYFNGIYTLKLKILRLSIWEEFKQLLIFIWFNIGGLLTAVLSGKNKRCDKNICTRYANDWLEVLLITKKDVIVVLQQ